MAHILGLKLEKMHEISDVNHGLTCFPTLLRPLTSKASSKQRNHVSHPLEIRKTRNRLFLKKSHNHRSSNCSEKEAILLLLLMLLVFSPVSSGSRIGIGFCQFLSFLSKKLLLLSLTAKAGKGAYCEMNQCPALQSKTRSQPSAVKRLKEEQNWSS